jgi:hypothetical protein
MITSINSNKFKEYMRITHPTLLVVGEYINAKSKVLVKGACGHEWEIVPDRLKSKGTGSTCRICNPVQVYNKKTQEQFEQEVATITPNIKVVGKYINAKTSILVECNDCHNTWSIIPDNFLTQKIGSICRKCTPAITRKKSTEQFIADLSLLYPTVKVLSEYTHSRELIQIGYTTCDHTTQVRPNNILERGDSSICPQCNPNTSNKELELLTYIKSIYSGWVISGDRDILEGKEIDIVLPDLGLAFEFNGVYHHREEIKGSRYHLDKTIGVENFGYQLIHINEDEWINKQDIVKSRIKSILGSTDQIGARKCIVKEIGFPREFLEANHIQGAGSPSSINLGLFYYDELVAVMTFSTPKFTKGYDYELVRYCSLLDITVVGGASKLLKYFIKGHKGSIISYSDRRWSTGALYKKLGFEYLHTSAPNYRYYRGLKSLSRYQCQKHKLKELFPEVYKEEMTEVEIMKEAGYYRVFDCGNDVWVLK